MKTLISLLLIFLLLAFFRHAHISSGLDDLYFTQSIPSHKYIVISKEQADLDAINMPVGKWRFFISDEGVTISSLIIIEPDGSFEWYIDVEDGERTYVSSSVEGEFIVQGNTLLASNISGEAVGLIPKNNVLVVAEHSESQLVFYDPNGTTTMNFLNYKTKREDGSEL